MTVDIYVTKTGSIYEVDTAGKRARRLSGAPNDHVKRMSLDGNWNNYVNMAEVLGGLLFDWKGDGKGTLTSVIVSKQTKPSTWRDELSDNTCSCPKDGSLN